MTFSSLFNDLIVLFSFLLAGFVIREIVKPLQRFYIPSSIVGDIVPKGDSETNECIRQPRCWD